MAVIIPVIMIINNNLYYFYDKLCYYYFPRASPMYSCTLGITISLLYLYYIIISFSQYCSTECSSRWKTTFPGGKQLESKWTTFFFLCFSRNALIPFALLEVCATLTPMKLVNCTGPLFTGHARSYACTQV